MAVPTQNLQWASALVVDPVSGQDNKAEPPAATKTNGYDFLETPPRQWINWWLDGAKDWFDWIKEELDNPGVSGESGIGTAAGKDFATEVASGISHATTTGSVTTEHLRQVNASTSCTASGAESQVNASDNCTATGANSQINASKKTLITPDAAGVQCQVNACVDCIIDSDSQMSQINASDHCEIDPGTAKVQMQINSSKDVWVRGTRSMINCSFNNSYITGDQSQLNCATGASYITGNNSQINATSGGNITSDYSQINASFSAISITGNYSQINACYDTVSIVGTYSQINASDGSSIGTNASEAQVNASDGCTISPAGATSNLQINASTNSCTATGSMSQVNASSNCDAIGARSQINNSVDCIISSGADGVAVSASDNCTCDTYDNVVLLASKFTKPGIPWSVVGGFGTTPAATANRTFEIDVQNGTGKITSSWTGSWSPSDFGELFENDQNGVIPLGTIVSLSNDKIKPGVIGDRILGVASATTAFLGNDSAFCWQGRYEKGDFGEAIYKKIPDPDFKGAKKDAPMIKVKKEDPKFDIERENIPRSERPDEWTAVALLGQVLVRLKADVKAGDYIAADGSKSNEQTRLECMKISKKFTAKKDHAIGLCLIR